MSEKELLYIDDVLGHITQADDFLVNYMDDVEDEKFLETLESFEKLNKEMYKKFYKLIGA